MSTALQASETHVNTSKRKSGLVSAGLVVVITAVLLAAAGSAGSWYAIVVTAAATVWFASIAFQDRPLTAEEKRIRAHLRSTAP